MKKSYIYLLLAFVLIGGNNIFAHEFFHDQNNHHSNLQIASSKTKKSSPYLNNNGNVIKVSDLKTVTDEEYVTLQGYILKKIRHEKYLFKDSTGEIMIEIDNKINYQLEDVNEKTLVEIYGEYDKEQFEKNKIDVKKITIIK